MSNIQCHLFKCKKLILKLSIVIPTLNEAQNIGKLLDRLHENSDSDEVEIIVADGGSSDGTPQIASSKGAKVVSSERGRAVQMNAGAAAATSEILYFVHADTLPPPNFMSHIRQALEQNFQLGCFRFQFDSDKWLLKINSFFTRFDRPWCRGGDQTLFVTKAVFDEFDGYRNDFLIMEEYDFLERVRQKYSFKIMADDVLVSARKYEKNTWLQVQIANFSVFRMYRKGVPQAELAAYYKRALKV